MVENLDSSPAPDLAANPAFALAAVFQRMLQAATVTEVLAAAVACVSTMAPACMLFESLLLDESGQPVARRLRALWQHDELQENASQLGTISPIDAQNTLCARWLSDPADAVFLSDVTSSGPHATALLVQCMPAPPSSVVWLPLYDAHLQAWHGLLTMAFTQPIAHSVLDRGQLSLLCRFIATRLSQLQSGSDLQTALDTERHLGQLSGELHRATSPDHAARALHRAVPQAAQCSLSFVEVDEFKQVLSVQPMARFAPSGTDPQPTAPLLREVARLVVARWRLENTRKPLVLGPEAIGRELTEPTQESLRVNSVRCVVALGLFQQDRLMGLLVLLYGNPQTLDSKLEYILTSLAGQAAPILATWVLQDRYLQASQKSQTRDTLLAAVLGHLPMGLAVLHAATRTPHLLSHAIGHVAAQPIVLGQPIDQVSLAFPILNPRTKLPYAEDAHPIARAMADHTSYRLEVAMTLEHGGERHLEVLIEPIAGETSQVEYIMLLLIDITPRKLAEADRAHIREEMITVQAAALAERSTPLIPITSEMLVVPLIGSLDAARGTDLMDTLLAGINRSPARVVILDITGVRTLDTQAARSLMEVAQAVRMLGCEAILTGIRAEVAQTLVTLGIHLKGLSTRSTLQDGIKLGLSLTSRA